ncbi:MAG: hypothetical protein H0X24_03480 [Ktedonobacterales bacterium]|nr:hypothetical protein [Ktedonobacterales bacterium]
MSRLLHQQIPADRPVQLAEGQRQALAEVWSTLQPGEWIIIIADEVNDIRAILHDLENPGQQQTKDDCDFSAASIAATEAHVW